MNPIDHVRRAQETLRTVREAYGDFATPPSATKAHRIALALFRASLDDAYAATLLLGHTDRPLISPATALLRVLTEKIKRATWAVSAPDQKVETAFTSDKFPGGNELVKVIEANEPSHTLYTQLHAKIGSTLHAYVHGGRNLIESYFDDRLNDQDFLRKTRDLLADGVNALAIEVGLAAAELVGKYDYDAALRAAEKVSALAP